MISKTPKEIPVRQAQEFLLGGIAPRPIALVSTLSIDGEVNLSPFSFFNAFGANPPTVAFSPARRLRDNTTKHTYENILATRECVIHAVTHAMVQQVSLASTDYAPGVNEFIKAGFTQIPSDLVQPPRVAESPFQMECRLVQMIELGGAHASGNLALCEVLKFHVSEDIMTSGVIDPRKIDLVARMGADFYCHANGDSIFTIKKPVERHGVGIDKLSERVRRSFILTGNHLGQLGNSEQFPDIVTITEIIRTVREGRGETSVAAYGRARRLGAYLEMLRITMQGVRSAAERTRMIHETAAAAIDGGQIDFALAILMWDDDQGQ